jgi:hypothetical protein
VKLKDLREQIADAASTVASAWELVCVPYVPDSIDPPTLFVRPSRIEYDLTFGRGTDGIDLDVLLLVSRVEDRDAQEFLDGFLDGGGASSVKTAIEATRGSGPGHTALGGTCDDVHVPTFDAYHWYPIGGVEYLGARWSVHCIGSGV